MAKVLMIDSDEVLPARVAEELAAQGGQLSHQPDWRDDTVERAEQNLNGHIDIVVINRTSLGELGRSACEAIKEASAPRPKVIVLSASDSVEDKIAAFSGGCDDYLSLPVDERELATKILLADQQRQHEFAINNELEQMRATAFQAMMTSSELGEMLRFLHDSMEQKDQEGLARALFDVLGTMDLRGTLQVVTDHFEGVFTDDGERRPLEEEILASCYGGDRLIDFGQRTIINYPSCALLIRNMPLDNSDRYGMLRDNLCILMEVIQARLDAMALERQAVERSRRLMISLNVVRQIMEEMEAHRRDFTDQSTRIIEDMMAEMRAEFCSLDLNEDEEARLTQRLDRSGDELRQLFDITEQRAEIVGELMERLLASMK